MAANLAKAGHAVAAFDISEDALAKAREAGAATAASVAEAAARREVVVTMLPAGAEVSEVYRGAGGVLSAAAPGNAAHRLLDHRRRYGAIGGGDGGRGRLAAPGRAGLGRCRRRCGKHAHLHGGRRGGRGGARPTGAGRHGQGRDPRRRLRRGPDGQGLQQPDPRGLDDRRLRGLRHGRPARARSAKPSSTSSPRRPAQCWALTSYCPVPGPVEAAPSNRDYAPGFTAQMMLKDLRLAQAAAASAGAASPLGAEAAALYTLFCNAGNGADDFFRHHEDDRPGGVSGPFSATEFRGARRLLAAGRPRQARQARRR